MMINANNVIEIKDAELESLIDLSGLDKYVIASRLNITPQHLSRLISMQRGAMAKRNAIKNYLVKYIVHFTLLAA